MSKTRRHFTAEQKAAIVRRHVGGKEAISKLADEFGVQPSQIHLWVKQVLEAAERAFERSPGQRKGEGVKDRKIEHLEAGRSRVAGRRFEAAASHGRRKHPLNQARAQW